MTLDEVFALAIVAVLAVVVALIIFQDSWLFAKLRAWWRGLSFHQPRDQVLRALANLQLEADHKLCYGQIVRCELEIYGHTWHDSRGKTASLEPTSTPSSLSCSLIDCNAHALRHHY